MKIRTVVCSALLALAYQLAGVATAQDIITLHSALQPGAGYIIPGTQQVWVDPTTGATGFRYQQ